ALFSILSLIALSGCGDSTPAPTGSGTGSTTAPAKAEQKKPKAGATTPYDPAKATGSIKGVATFEGKAPTAKEIDVSGVKACADLHKEPMLEEDFLVKDGKFQNVLVYVKSVDGVSPEDKWEFTAPKTS